MTWSDARKHRLTLFQYAQTYCFDNQDEIPLIKSSYQHNNYYTRTKSPKCLKFTKTNKVYTRHILVTTVNFMIKKHLNDSLNHKTNFYKHFDRKYLVTFLYVEFNVKGRMISFMVYNISWKADNWDPANITEKTIFINESNIHQKGYQKTK